MDQPTTIPRPMGFPMMGQPPMGQPSMGQPQMGQIPMGQPPMGQTLMGQPMMGQPMMGQPIQGGFNQNIPPALRQQFAAPLFNPFQNSQKINQFSRGVYVSGFEKTLTPIMLEERFKIKPISGLRLPLTKHLQNKGFAFVYYHSAEDASYVKEKLDHSVILKNKIRVTKTVVADNLSKMMFKLKKELTEKQLKEAKEKYFTEKNLETEVNKIIRPIFDKHVEVNKIIIPHSKIDKDVYLNYARGFFYISNITEAKRTALLSSTGSAKKEEYESVLKFIAEKLNSDPEFSKYVRAEIYEYANKNKQNVIHIKNINIRPDEDTAKVAEQLKAFIQEQRRQDQIKGCYVGQFDKKAGWANITFDTYEQAVNAYEHFKNNRVFFREKLIYANLRNVKDLRTVVVSVVRPDAKEQQVREFLKNLSEQSPRVDANDESKGRRYDWASFKIIQSKTFYLDNQHHSVGLINEQKPEESWRQINSVPRRVVIHFMNEITDKDLRQLVAEIKLKPNWEQIFFEKDRKTVIKASHQKGHIENDYYVKHNDPHKKKNEPQQRINKGPGKRPPTDQAQFNFQKGNRGPPKMFNANRGPAPVRPQPPMGAPRQGGQIGSMPQMGGFNNNPKLGGLPIPQMPMMGGVNKMGGNMPPMGMGMGGGLGQPTMGAPTMGGFSQPIMGGMPPPTMGGVPLSFMGGVPKQGIPPMGVPKPAQQSEKKQ